MKIRLQVVTKVNASIAQC